VEKALNAIGLSAKASAVRAGLVACTGNTGCKFALANTKDTAMAIAAYVDARVALDTPVNIHLTGCPNSCAQHYIGDLGLIATRVPVAPDSDDTVEGFNIHVGGGYGPDARIAREIFPATRIEDVPAIVTRILRAYLDNRDGAETFLAFASRHEIADLKTMIDAIGSEA
jgi:ferredoxin-nitrite reductase